MRYSLPVIVWLVALFLPLLGVINLPWSVLFGVVGHGVEALVPHRPGAIDLIGTIVWPMVLMLLLGFLIEHVGNLGEHSRRAAKLLLVASLVAVWPIEGVLTTAYGKPFALEGWPLYIRLFMY